jgi:hypothetical protein
MGYADGPSGDVQDAPARAPPRLAPDWKSHRSSRSRSSSVTRL